VATAAGSLITTVLLRVRDPDATAHPRAFVLALLTEAQRCVNGAASQVVETATLTTAPARQCYAVEANLSNALRIVGIRDEAGRDLTRTPWSALAHGNRRWWRQLGSRPLVWSLVGRDLLVLHPATPDAQTLTVAYVKKTATLSSETSVTETTDDVNDFVLALTEVILLLKARRLDGVAGPLGRLAAFASDRLTDPAMQREQSV